MNLQKSSAPPEVIQECNRQVRLKLLNALEDDLRHGQTISLEEGLLHTERGRAHFRAQDSAARSFFALYYLLRLTWYE